MSRVNIICDRWQWITPTSADRLPPDWVRSAIQLAGTPDRDDGVIMRLRDQLHVGTPIGVMVAGPRDWVIRDDNMNLWVLSEFEMEMTHYEPEPEETQSESPRATGDAAFRDPTDWEDEDGAGVAP